jgi:hypothetical protein
MNKAKHCWSRYQKVETEFWHSIRADINENSLFGFISEFRNGNLKIVSFFLHILHYPCRVVSRLYRCDLVEKSSWACHDIEQFLFALTCVSIESSFCG